MEPKVPPKQDEQLVAPKKPVKVWLSVVGIAVILIVVTIVGGITIAYKQALQPVNEHSKQTVRFEIQKGQGNAAISENLQKAHLIQSAPAMVLYLKLHNQPAGLQAGTFVLSPKMSVQQIVAHLASGKTDTFNVTILPGRTLDELKKDFLKYGYSEEEINTALKAQYTSQLLADKPKNADLEGYIFPETFEVGASDNLQRLINRSMNTLYDRMSKDGLIDAFKAKGLTVYQALTLASIVQKEASKPADQPQIAQVFLLRLQNGMKLESDVTFHYAAKKLGVTPRVDLNSPYNTRLVGGLPPGPIANMNYSALQAVASPSQGDYVYFIAGDDGKIYFAHTLEQHQENIKKYCHTLCGNAS